MDMSSSLPSCSKSTTTPSTSTRKTKHNTNCCVYQCHSRKGADKSVHFHYFPAKNSGIKVKMINALGQEEQVDKRKAWEKVLLMGKPVTSSMRVCSKHFKADDYCAKNVKLDRPKLKRFAVPSQSLPQKETFSDDKNKRKSAELRKERAAKRQKGLKEQTENIRDIPICESDLCVIDNSSAPRKFEDLLEEEKVAVQNLLELGSSEIPVPLYENKGIQVSSGDIAVTFLSTIKEEKHLNSLTGIATFTLLNALSSNVEKMYPDIRKRKLSIRERIVLVFMKLKMGLKLNVLSFLFKISPSLCKIIFIDYVKILAKILESCIYWAPYAECQQNMPICFNELKSVRVVLDCLEVPIEKPKCLCCRVRTYSHYKGRHTLKTMTGVSPGGLLTFLSKSYGGRASDKAIFMQSNLIKKLEPKRDSVLVDKGFLIDDICELHAVKIVRPHFLKKKKQFSEKESKENIMISKARVHIERVNQRMRIFSILNTPLAVAYISLADDILKIICGMVNLQNPILGESRFNN